MTINAVRRKLKSIRHIRKEIELIGYQIEELRTRAESAGGWSDEFHGHGDPTQSKVENCVLQIVAYQQKLIRKQLALQGSIEIAEGLIELLKHDKESILRSTLRSIYIMGNTQEKTAELLEYSARQIRNYEYLAVKLISRRENTKKKLATLP